MCVDLITLDYETYYDQEYSLSKISTEDYINSPLFEVIMVSLKINDQPSFFHSGDMKSTKEFLFDNGVPDCGMIAQNTMFDQLINQVHFNIRPPVLFDTMAMAQALLKPVLRSISLGAILKHLNLGVQKGTYVANMKGRRREGLSARELQEYGRYCMGDTDGEYAAFQHMLPLLPRQELEIIDMTLRMYLDPQLELDGALLQQILEKVQEEKFDLMMRLPPDIQRADLMSNAKLAKMLTELGVEVPMKISPTTNKSTWAFAKTDPQWKDMEEEYADHPLIAPILAARIGTKSTLIETRTERFIDIAASYKKFRVPLKYYAALTGRYGGWQKINCQNLTRIDPKNPDRRQIRYALKAPKHHVVLVHDLKQNEARSNAWLSGCVTLLDIFRAERDAYSEFASKLYHRAITKADEKERFVGKTCILGLGYGMGAKKLRATLRKDDIKLEEHVAYEYVNTYRETYSEIPELWKYCDEVIEILAFGGKRAIAEWGPCYAADGVIVLPNGMPITYHNLRRIDTAKYSGWVYDYGGRTRTLWGGKVVENIIQSFGRIMIMDHMITIKKELGISPVMQAHDELVNVVLERDVEYYRDAIAEIMMVPPEWAPDLPMGVDSGFGATYGDAK
jgi:DNA polymerase